MNQAILSPKRGTTFCENPDPTSTISMACTLKSNFTVQLGHENFRPKRFITDVSSQIPPDTVRRPRSAGYQSCCLYGQTYMQNDPKLSRGFSPGHSRPSMWGQHTAIYCFSGADGENQPPDSSGPWIKEGARSRSMKCRD